MPLLPSPPLRAPSSHQSLRRQLVGPALAIAAVAHRLQPALWCQSQLRWLHPASRPRSRPPTHPCQPLRVWTLQHRMLPPQQRPPLRLSQLQSTRQWLRQRKRRRAPRVLHRRHRCQAKRRHRMWQGMSTTQPLLQPRGFRRWHEAVARVSKRLMHVQRLRHRHLYQHRLMLRLPRRRQRPSQLQFRRTRQNPRLQRQ